MAKGSEQKATNNLINTNLAQNQQEHNQDRTMALGGNADAYGRSNQTFDPTFAGYKSLAETGGLSDADKERFRGILSSAPASGSGGPDTSGLQSLYGSMASGSSIDQNSLRVGMPTLKWLMDTGGYDPAKEALIQGDIGELRTLGRTGGINEEDKARYRGNGVFDEFSKTGGLSDTDRQMLRARGNSGIASIYGQSKQELSRLNRVSGGNNAGTGALLSRLTRDGARAAQDSALNTELGITDRVNEGRKWGAEGASQSEASLQDRLANTKLSGLLGALEHGRGVEEYKGTTKLGASSKASDVEANIASMLMEERARGAAGLAGLASMGGGGSSGPDYNDKLSLEKWLYENSTDGKLAGLNGLGQLNSSSLNEGQSYRDFLLNERGLTSGNQNTGVDQRIANNPRFNWGQVLSGVIGAGAGVGSSLIGAKK